MKRPRLAISTILAVFVLIGCSKNDRPTAPETNLQTPKSFQTALAGIPVSALTNALDHSLSVQEYLDLGMPAPDRTWFYTDYKQAAAVLQKIFDEDMTKLPRYHGPKSGAIFEQMVSDANLTILTNASLPVQVRGGAIEEYLQAVKTMLLIYGVRAPLKGLIFDEESVEMERFMLTISATSFVVVDQFLASLSKQDANSAGRAAALNQIKDGAAQQVSSVLIILADRQDIRQPARKRLVISLQRILPGLIARLSTYTQNDFLAQIRRLGKEEPDNEVRRELQSLANLLSKQ